MNTLSQTKDIMALFVHQEADMPNISTPSSPPTYTTMLEFQSALDDNAMAVPAPNTDLGHAALTMKKNDFTQANGSDYIDPVDPGPAPTAPSTISTPSISTRSTTASTTSTTTPSTTTTYIDPFPAQEAIRKWQEEKTIYTTWRTTHTCLKNQIIHKVDDQYISTLKHARTKYATVSANDMMKHLWNTYGKIDMNDLTANETRMKQQWAPPTPIEALFKQLKDGQAFAASGKETISDSQLVRFGYDIMTNTGVLSRPCTKWRNENTGDQTWPKFMTHFTAAVKDYNKNITSSDMKYSAAQVQELVDQRMCQYVIESPEPDTTTTTSSANATQITPSMEAMFETWLQNRNSHQGNSRPGPILQPQTTTPLVCQGYDDKGKPITYCWSHGITQNLKHDSKNCIRKKEGHKENATLHNKMGGCEDRMVPRRRATQK